MTLLALVRHAETPWSKQGRVQGRTDIALSEAGRTALTARQLPAEFRDLRAFTSPLRRCTETAALLGLGHAQHEPRLAEMSWGEWEGRVLAELRAQFGDAMRENEARGLDFTPPGGESPRKVLARVGGWLGEIATAGRSTLAVTHRGVIRAIFATATGWDMLGKPSLKLDWNALHVFRLDRDGAPSAVRMNVPLLEKRPDVASA